MPRYIFNKETLSYEEISSSKKFRLTRNILFLVGCAVLACGYLFVYTSLLGHDLPRTALLKKNNAKLSSRLELLNRDLDNDASYLASFEQRDNDVYRSVYGMNGIPPEIRNAGFGGVNRYSHLDGLDNSGLLRKTEMRLDILTKKAYVQSRSYDEVESVAKKAVDLQLCIPSVPPISPDRSIYRLSSSFGYRTDPFTKKVRSHTGMDFALPEGNPVRSTADGVVEKVRNDYFGYGHYVIVNHGFGYKTRYAHLSRIDVKVGDTVRRGTQVGASGNTGRSSGPHLHYEVMYKDRYVNPINYMDLDMTVDEYGLLSAKAEAGANGAGYGS